MRYWLLGIGGVVLIALSVAAVSSGLYGLVLTGSCSDGGLQESARPCPAGTGLRIVMLVLGVFATIFGVAVFAARGGSAATTGAVGMATWCCGFGALAAAVLYAGFGPDATDPSTGSRVFSAVMGGFFLLFLAPVLIFRRGRKPRGRAVP